MPRLGLLSICGLLKTKSLEEENFLANIDIAPSDLDPESSVDSRSSDACKLSLPAAAPSTDQGTRLFVSPSNTSGCLGAEEAARGASDALTTPWRSSMAVVQFSNNPFGDFRRSMLEMVEAKAEAKVATSTEVFEWEYMDELLDCYLRINDRSVHEEIERAFVDLTASFRFIAR
ncbi:transcription repressor OFP14 [Canna indica]|uniref:Transcription repressor n=1 Tax=Canna indica TaxID=4628 RepID=A0AAQ3QGX5_9LILI|nr:transcription repressor OFP14 [Canna indica]